MIPTPFDLTALTGFLDGEHAGTREKVRRLLSSPEFAEKLPLLSETGREAHRAQVLDWCRRLAAEGIGALGLPREHGGGGDPAAFLAAFETIAHHDLSLLVKFGVQLGLFAGSLHRLGTERHHAAYLAAAGSLDLLGCFAMTETGHGSNVADLETTARFEPDPLAGGSFVLHTPGREARKDYIGGAARDARLAVVFAQLETLGERQGVHAFAVPIRDAAGNVLPGLQIEDCGPKLGLNGVDNGRIAFDNVRVPREALLDRFAAVAADGTYTSPIDNPGKRFFIMLGTLVGGRVSVALASVAAAKSALCIAVRYAERRRQFGAPGEPETLLLDYPAHQRRLLPRLATTYALHFALRDLAAGYVKQAEEEDSRRIEALAAGLKAVATWHATDTLQACREACGGQGYLAVNRFAALKADSDVFTTFEGDNTVLLQLVAKGLLSDYRKQFGDMDFVDMMRYVAAWAGTTVRDLNPIVTRLTDPDHLRDPDFHLAALGWREEHLLATVARRLKKRLDAGMEPAQAMLECQTHLLATARAHADRVIVETAERAAAALSEGPAAELAAVLRPLLALHALSRLEAESGWLLEHGVLEAAKARAIRKEVDALCRELRPIACDLVDAFAIPDELLAAPIAV